MDLDKVYIDQFLLDSLERLSINEGWISSEANGEPLSILYTSPRSSNRIANKGKLLRLFTLFDKIDSNFSGLDWSKFIDYGVIEPKSKMLDHSANKLHFDFMERETDEQENLFNCHMATYHLLKNQKNRIINYHTKKSLPGWYKRGGSAANTNDLACTYHTTLDCLLETNDTGAIFGTHPHLSRFQDDVYFIWASIRNGLFYSTKHNVTLSTIADEQSKPVPVEKPNLIEDLYYTVKTNLSDELLILPQPRSIEEALDLRTRKEMIQFREVLSEWLSTLRLGTSNAELKIRLDLAKANKDLKRIKQWKQYKESPFNFWLNSLGGHIPIFSNILTVVNMTGELYSSHREKKIEWLALVQNQD